MTRAWTNSIHFSLSSAYTHYTTFPDLDAHRVR
jgi:hypothetical protein